MRTREHPTHAGAHRVGSFADGQAAGDGASGRLGSFADGQLTVGPVDAPTIGTFATGQVSDPTPSRVGTFADGQRRATPPSARWAEEPATEPAVA